MSTTTLTIGPEHDGQPMWLADFERATACDDASYELGRGIVYRVEVSGVFTIAAVFEAAKGA